ncbi:MAG: hypothetical protein QNJ47_22885 [Nostocaceae cyanobacterium]|nr:hypothetical protein [Nostocaceae cyanobacterium]
MKTSNNKTPIGYFEQVIAELRSTQEELQAELKELRELKKHYAELEEQLKSTTQELQTVKAELENIKVYSQQIKEQTQQNIDAVKNGIENGSIVVQKAVMLRGVDDEHWMGFYKLDAVNHHCLRVWRSSDNTWHDDIRVKASFFLRARNSYNWMVCTGVYQGSDVFRVWNLDIDRHFRFLI